MAADQKHGTRETSEDAEVREKLIEKVSGAQFEEWYSERRTAENVLAGQAFFNTPAPEKEPERHSPSQLRQCPRKMSYRRQNAPKEGEVPSGIFWVGEQVEEELVVAFLQEAVTVDETYVANSVWIDTTVEAGEFELQIRGVTDPVITTAAGDPLVVFEVKSTTSIEYLDGPKPHHRAQLQAYLYALDAGYDHEVQDGVVLYVDRDTLAVKAFHEPFDAGVWRDVTEWMADLTSYERNGELPPASPEQSWECKFCDFKHRCGEADTPFSDVGYDGLLPLFDGYDRQNLEEYLEAHEGRDARLTPSLAHQHPDLLERYGAYDWSCVACGATYEWDAVDWDGDVDEPPYCVACIETGDMVVLSGPEPGDQLTT